VSVILVYNPPTLNDCIRKFVHSVKNVIATDLALAPEVISPKLYIDLPKITILHVGENALKDANSILYLTTKT